MVELPFSTWMVQGVGDDAFDEEAFIKDYAGTIDLGVYTIPQLMKEMGPYINQDADLVTVARALAVLPPIFQTLTESPSRQDIHVLVEYLCARLENKDEIHNYRAGIREVAESLQAIANWKRFIPDDGVLIITAVFGLASGSTFKDQKPSTRLALFRLIDFMFWTYERNLTRNKSVKYLVEGLISMAELEKSPACLSVVFPLYEHISKEWDLNTPDFNGIWDSFIRYFPITVGSAAQDSSAPITREELKTYLLQCIISNDVYAEFAFPRLIDMLDTKSDLSANTKKEVLATFAACCASYKQSTLNEWSSKIWDALKFEVWNGEEEDSIKGSLQILHNLAESLSKSPFPLDGVLGWDLNEDSLSYFAIPAINECSTRIHDSRKQYLIPSGRILQAIASASPYSFYLVIRKVLPALLLIWQDLKLGSEKKSLLTVLNNILQARVDQALADDFVPSMLNEEEMPIAMHDYLSESMEKMGEAFGRFRDGLVEVYSAAVSDMKKVSEPQDDSFGLPAIHGLALLFKIPGYLSDAEMGMVVEQLNRIALDLRDKKEIHAEALFALHQISVEAEGVFKITLSNYVLELPEKISPIRPGSYPEELESVIFKLQDLIELSYTAPLKLRRIDEKITTKMWHDHFDQLQSKLSDKLQSILHHGGQQEYATAILAAICTSMERFDETAQLRIDLDPTLLGTYNTIVLDIIVKLAEQKRGPVSNNRRYTAIKTLPNGKLFDDEFVKFAGRAAMYALRSKLSAGQHNFIADWNRRFAGEPNCVWDLFTHGDGNVDRAEQWDLTAGPPEKCLANVLSMFLVAGLRPQDKNQLYFHVGDVAAAMMQNAISTQNPCSKLARLSMLWFFQLLVNKFGATKEVLTNDSRSLLGIMLDLVDSSISKTEQQAIRIFQLLAYFTSATLASFDQAMKPLVRSMIDGVANDKYGRKVARSFRILLGPSEILNKENFCTIRSLRNSRLFAMSVEPLISLWSSSVTSDIKENCLIALAGVLYYVDPSFIVENEESIGLLPLILEGTNVQNDEWAKAAFIKTIRDLIPLIPLRIEEHLDSVINRMTDRTHNTLDSPSDGSARCRELALEVLANLTKHVNETSLVKRKFGLMSELDIAVDDPSRDVRAKAVETKMAWFNIGLTTVGGR